MKTPLVVIACLTVLGCKDSTGPLNVASYPLSSGSVWTYHVKMSTYDFRPIRQGATFRDTSIEEDMKTEILGTQTLHDSVRTVKFRGTSTGNTGTDICYYTLSNNILSIYAYESAGATDVLPKRSSPRYCYRYRGHSFSSIPELSRFIELGLPEASVPLSDSITYEANPPKVLVYPLVVGNEWSYYNPSPKINKRVLSQENLTEPAGAFLTYKIQTLYDWNNSGVWDTTLLSYDNIAQQGLVKRTLTALNLVITAATGPDSLGYIDLKIQHDLTSLKIQ